VAANAIIHSDPGLEAFGGSRSSQEPSTQTNSPLSDQSDYESFSDDSPWSEGSDYENAAANDYNRSPGGKAMGKKAGNDQREISTLLRMIKFLVVCLYRMPIRQFAATEQIKTQISEKASFYRHFDVLFVRDLFPRMDETAATNLGRAISQRRSILLYKDARYTQSEDSDFELDPSQFDRTPFKLPSKATTYMEKPSQQPWLYPPSSPVAISEKSTVSVYATQELTNTIPEMPVSQGSIENGAFVCPYCCIPQRDMSETLWKNHVFHDLQPYVCTFPSCGLQDHFFTDRTQWWQHEIEVHRFAWHCNTRHHQSYDEQEKFLRHMQEAHSTSFTSKQLCELTPVFRSPSTKAAGVCNLCFRHSENLKSHVSRHLQRIALFALPRFKGESDITSQYVRGENSLESAPVTGLQEDTNMAADIVTVPERRYENEKTEDLGNSLGKEPNYRPSALLQPKFSSTAEQTQLRSNGDVVQFWLRSADLDGNTTASMC
jgi:hypothetical protein